MGLPQCFDCSHRAVVTDLLLRRLYCLFHWTPRLHAIQHEERIRAAVKEAATASLDDWGD